MYKRFRSNFDNWISILKQFLHKRMKFKMIYIYSTKRDKNFHIREILFKFWVSLSFEQMCAKINKKNKTSITKNK